MSTPPTEAETVFLRALKVTGYLRGFKDKANSLNEHMQLCATFPALSRNDFRLNGVRMADVTSAPARASWRRRHWRKITVLMVILIPILIFAGWAWVTTTLHYSAGDRAGYAQKLSEKGWICKTWEGELAIGNVPGSMPEIFKFTVRSDALAKTITNNLGKR